MSESRRELGRRLSGYVPDDWNAAVLSRVCMTFQAVGAPVTHTVRGLPERHERGLM